MKFNAELEGLDDALNMLKRFVKQEDRAEKAMIENIALDTANIARDINSGNYRDRTGNLRNSVGVNADHKDIVYGPSDNQIEFPGNQMTPKAEVKRNEKTSYVYAGMNYAQKVEDKDGFSVLQDAVDRVEPIAKKHALEFLKPENVMKQK